MNNQILLGLVTIGLVASVVGVGTYAYFSDTETSMGNTLAAGTLDLDDGIAEWGFDIGDMKPSYDMETEPLTLKWTSNPGKIYKVITKVECGQGVSSEPEETREREIGEPVYDLDNVVEFNLHMWDGEGWVTLISYDDEFTVGDLVGVPIFLGMYGKYPTGGEVTIKQTFHMMTEAGNEYQGDSCTIDEEFVLLQDNDPEYDKLCNVAGDICWPE